jgi:hypothetical protein
MVVVKFFAKSGFESFGSFFESGFCPRHVPDHCVQSFWTKDNNSERHNEDDFCPKAQWLLLRGAVGGGTGGDGGWLVFVCLHG